ncbi:flagellar basal body rod protein FlgB [Ancylobacter radicis]|uniref:Flagellar basal body rod protein FlgB n=1 Tax=Ancylobacter radicis TaxID=2836179 RepID=A0ABS5RCC7_9HYPH|nr:flagellar basal body rod protein FlgB [Ancylobacter radicis]MBS9479313.1 flagellar basal body rod protein FlgB [Ancylobacter radicis]
MDKVYLFDLASRHAAWASVRQATIASNIANANTPGYRAAEVEPFASVLDRTHLAEARTNPGHLSLSAPGAATVAMDDADSWSVSESGNTVSIDQQMVKASEVSGAFSLNTSIVRSFHKMVLASVRNS